MQYVRAKVTGSRPIRDCLTREAVEPGGEVRLYPRQIGVPAPACARHPKKGVRRSSEACTCHTTVLEPLLESGAIELIEDKGAKAKS